MTSKYDKSRHVLVEQNSVTNPTMGERHKNYESLLRTIPCVPGSIWEEDKIYEEGKDYSVLDFSDGRGNHQFEVIPIPKEDDNREIIENILYTAGIPQMRATEIAEAILMDIKPQQSFSREEVRQFIEDILWEEYGEKACRIVSEQWLEQKLKADSTKL